MINIQPTSPTVGIYKITSPSNKIYIGQSWDIKARKYVYSCLNCKPQRKLYNSLLKHGFENHTFEIIHKLPSDITQQILDDYETLYWKQYKECGFEMMNIKEPGIGGKHSEETRLKISESRKGRKDTEETKLKMSKSAIGHSRNLGKKHSKETKQKISDAKKGIPKSKEFKENISNILKGKIISEETKLKMSNASKGIPKSEQHKLNISKAKKRYS